MSQPKVGEIWRHKNFEYLYVFITGVGPDNIYFYQMRTPFTSQMRSKVLFTQWRKIQ